MKHYSQEYEPLEEVNAFKEQLKTEYKEFKKTLDQRKEFLFSKDIS